MTRKLFVFLGITAFAYVVKKNAGRIDAFFRCKQRSFTAVVQIKKGKAPEIKKILCTEFENFNKFFPQQMPVHFLRWFTLTKEQVVLNHDQEGVVPEIARDYLVFTMNYDQHLDDVLIRLYRYAGDFIDRLYANCEGYFSELPEADKLNFLKGNRVKESHFWVGKPGWTVGRIHAENRLRTQLEEKLSNISTAPFIHEAEQIRKSFQQEVNTIHAAHDASDPFLFRVIKRFIVVLIYGSASLVLLLPMTIYRYLKRKYKPENYLDLYNLPHLPAMAGENIILQNQLTIHGILRNDPLWFWRLKFKISLTIAKLIGGTKRNGKLAGLGSIHFVKWLVMPNYFIHPDGKKQRFYHCIFISDYDGTWESYISDFIDLGARAINFTFSNMRDYPKTSFLFKLGAYTGASFKKLVRRNQIECPFWYSNYKHLYINDVVVNAAIAKGVHQKNMSHEELKDWLKLFK